MKKTLFWLVAIAAILLCFTMNVASAVEDSGNI